jgi:hypothetical protein
MTTGLRTKCPEAPVSRDILPVLVFFGLLAGVAVFLMVMDIAHWKPRRRSAFEVDAQPPKPAEPPQPPVSDS